MKTISIKQVTDVIREFSADFEARRWKKSQVIDLRERLNACETIEEARILAFCEVENLLIPETGEFASLEDFRRQLKSEGLL
jgi:hypothetical protein